MSMDYEERRNDPVIRAEVERIVEARKVMLAEAAQELQIISGRMRELYLGGDDPIYNRCMDAVWRAANQVGGDAEFRKKIGGETYTGNMAAGQMGIDIERRMKQA